MIVDGNSLNTNLHGQVELFRGGQYFDVASWNPEGGYLLRHPLEMGAEAIGALSSG